MNINELENKLYSENLIVIYDGDVEKKYVKGNYLRENGKWINTTNVFGIYNSDDSMYCVFFTDSERGIPNYTKMFDTEEEACIALYERVARLKRIHNKNIIDVIKEYLINEKGYTEKRANIDCDDLIKHIDIASELVVALKSGIPDKGIEVNGYSAKILNGNYPLSLLGAYNYLVYLREEPDQALADLKKGLPRK